MTDFKLFQTAIAAAAAAAADVRCGCKKNNRAAVDFSDSETVQWSHSAKKRLKK